MKSRATGPTFPSIPSLLLVLAVLAVLVVLEVLGVLPPAEAQIPHATRYGKKLPEPYSTPLIRKYLKEGGFYHVVTVDPGGSGDFQDISEAFAFVASQNPTFASRWTIRIYPGDANVATGSFSYSESALTTPPFTTVQGEIATNGDELGFTGQVWVKLTAASGAALTLSPGFSLVNLGFYYSGPQTAAVSVVSAPAGVDGSIHNCQIFANPGSDSHALDLLSVTGGFLYARELHTFRPFTGTLSRNIKVTGGALVLFDSRIYPGANQPIAVEVTGGTVLVYGGRINENATTEFARTGGTLQIEGFTYATESGAINHGTLRGDKLFVHTQQTPASATAPCATGEWTADASFIYVCIATNTWKRAALAGW
jgi:hypothetical protein